MKLSTHSESATNVTCAHPRCHHKSHDPVVCDLLFLDVGHTPPVYTLDVNRHVTLS